MTKVHKSKQSKSTDAIAASVEKLYNKSAPLSISTIKKVVQFHNKKSKYAVTVISTLSLFLSFNFPAINPTRNPWQA